MTEVQTEFRDEAAFRSWLNQYDVSDREPALLASRFISGINLLGIDVFRSSLWLPTAHPELWGTQVIWSRGNGAEVFRRDHGITHTSTYIGTPGEAVHKERKTLRWNLSEESLPFQLLEEVKMEGGTDYLIIPFRTSAEKEQPWITFATKRVGGFSLLEVNTLEELCQPLSWKARVAIAEHSSKSLLSVYLGLNAARKVMAGKFKRGTGEKINAVIWFCDLRGFTELGDSYPAEELVKILDQYFECISEPIEANGGEVLKFIGDAVMAIFPLTDNPQTSCDRALNAAEQALSNLEQWSSQEDHPCLKAGIALHVGDVLYGNIGGSSRLDFTVIGASVNEASRVEALCKETYPVLVTDRFQQYIASGKLCSIGQRKLRGVSKALEIFTLAKYKA